MPQTYTPIVSTTLSSAVSTITFSNVPNTYTDLILVISAGMNASDYPLIRVGNNLVDTGSNYSQADLIGNGSSALSSRSSNAVYFIIGLFTSTSINNSITSLQNYANTTTNKTFLSRANTTLNQGTDSGTARETLGLWRSTSAINTIQVYNYSSQTFTVGSTFTIYGIKAA